MSPVHTLLSRRTCQRSATEHVTGGLTSVSASRSTPSFHIDPIRFDDFQLLLLSWEQTPPASKRPLTRNGQPYFTIAASNVISFITLFSPLPLYREMASQQMLVLSGSAAGVRLQCNVGCWSPSLFLTPYRLSLRVCLLVCK